MTQLQHGDESRDEKVSRLARRRQAMIDSYADRALDSATRARADARGPGWSGVAAWSLALCVHLLSFGLVATGLVGLVLGTWVLRVLALVPLLLGLLVAPKPSRHRGPEGLTRETAPALFGVLDRIAAHNRTPVPDAVALDGRLNLSVSRHRAQRVLTIGAPAWVAGSGQARVHNLAHELGHLAHGDLLSGAWIGTATSTAQRWQRFLDDVHDTSGVMSRLTLWLFATPWRLLCRGFLFLMYTVNASASRRMEFLADLDAISAAGSEGALAGFDAFLAQAAIDAALVRASARSDVGLARAEIEQVMASSDTVVRSRRREAAAEERSRADDSHPRTSLRIELVRRREWVPAGVVVDQGTWDRVDRELAPSIDAALEVAVRRRRYQR